MFDSDNFLSEERSYIAEITAAPTDVSESEPELELELDADFFLFFVVLDAMGAAEGLSQNIAS
jgi:hypothetical protein